MTDISALSAGDTLVQGVTPKPATTPVSKTAQAALGAVGSAAVLKWIFAMIAAHGFIAPDDGTVAMMGAGVAPFAHMFSLGIMTWFSRKTGVSVEELTAAKQLAAFRAEHPELKP